MELRRQESAPQVLRRLIKCGLDTFTCKTNICDLDARSVPGQDLYLHRSYTRTAAFVDTQVLQSTAELSGAITSNEPIDRPPRHFGATVGVGTGETSTIIASVKEDRYNPKPDATLTTQAFWTMGCGRRAVVGQRIRR
jgi:hypothetical protein